MVLVTADNPKNLLSSNSLKMEESVNTMSFKQFTPKDGSNDVVLIENNL